MKNFVGFLWDNSGFLWENVGFLWENVGVVNRVDRTDGSDVVRVMGLLVGEVGESAGEWAESVGDAVGCGVVGVLWAWEFYVEEFAE